MWKKEWSHVVITGLCFPAASARFDSRFERGGVAGGWNPTSKPANELARQGDTDRGSSPYARGNAGEERDSRFTWHPGRRPETQQEVEIEFMATADGTRVVLTHTNWEAYGDKASEVRSSYDRGWDCVLGQFTTVADDE